MLQSAGKNAACAAIDLLIKELKADDSEDIREAAAKALGRMDAAAVVPKIEADYDTGDTYDRMRIGEVLGLIKHPAAEAAAMRLIDRETDDEVATSHCMALVDLCTTEGLEQLRRTVIRDKYDTRIGDIKDWLVTLSKMVGYEAPELQQWREEIADERIVLHDETERRADSAQTWINRQSAMRQPLSSPPPAFTRLVPIRRETPKIGRNDPCPCGSGKKYKKCCG